MTEPTASLEQRRASTPLSGGNAGFVESYYEQYLLDPNSVDPAWRDYFRTLNGGGTDIAHGPIRETFVDRGGAVRTRVVAGGTLDADAANKQAAVLRLLNYYRVRGHQAANLDPLGLAPKTHVPDLDPAFHGLSEADMATVFDTGTLMAQQNLPLREILRIVRDVYTGAIGAEYMYITDTKEKRWIQQRLETAAFKPKLTPKEQGDTLRQLTAAEGIERYLHTKYVGQKRFSLEGGDSLIAALDEVIRRASQHKMDEVVIGMAHRGRLNVLVNILGKSPKDLFGEFEGKYAVTSTLGSGDVKYHSGFSTDVDMDGHRMHLVLAFNPSHLEIVNPVVVGSVRARQDRRGDADGKLVLPVQIHGDAAFAGQGVVMETLQLSQAKGYSTGGTMHIIVNNQIGFTTLNPIEAQEGRESRSSLYCTDLAKMLDSPVFHVNGDDPEAVVFVTRLAMDFRAEFRKDVFIDLVCYRRHGHNEADEPAVTQPLMYQKVRSHATARTLYAKKLVADNIVQVADPDQWVAEYRTGLDQGENIVRKTLGMVGNRYTVDWNKHLGGNWEMPVKTGVTAKIIKKLSDRMTDTPEGFELHARVAKIVEDRDKMAEGKLPMDWGFAETMAYASLLDEGCRIRISGQDVGRGTFFHRHAVLHNQKDGRTLVPLEHIGKKPSDFTINDSLLSEEGVVGFEYGYSTADPQTLVIWEAQFGDFANGAQVVIDQFIASGYAKWGRLCGLTLFLPHGYEGQGPEHSSARLERYLQLCAENNMQVCVPSTPAQMFHMIRRQALRPYKLPLIVMTPKSLLRHKLSVSAIDELENCGFQPLIPETNKLDAGQIERVVFCSGKVYFDLYQAREQQGLKKVALARIEQLYPFPREQYAAAIAQYPNLKEIVWCQEEPENQGAWYPIKHRINEPLTAKQQLFYATRPGAASTAVGYGKLHTQQQEQVVREALTGGKHFRG
ncbi:MAG: 2-oxoglutarate dehydrogenase E1 component [Nevskiales bacterium]